MTNYRRLEVVEYLDDSRIIVRYCNRKYVRTVRTCWDGSKYIKLNNQEFAV